MELKMAYYPNPVLRKVSKKITKVTDEHKEIVKQMFKMLYEEGGLALAAPQAGLLQRMIVANISADANNKQAEEVYINPKILKTEEEIEMEEGCLSLPGITFNLKRFRRIKVRYIDLDGNEIEKDAEYLYAQMFQHELDHLDGILIIDRLPPMARKQFAEYLRALENEYRAGRKPVIPHARTAKM